MTTRAQSDEVPFSDNLKKIEGACILIGYSEPNRRAQLDHSTTSSQDHELCGLLELDAVREVGSPAGLEPPHFGSLRGSQSLEKRTAA